MTSKRAAKNNDASVTEGVGPEADEATQAAIDLADQANVAAANEGADLTVTSQVVDEEGNVVVNVERVGASGRVGAIATTAMKNLLATAYATNATFAAAFTADPGSTGTATGEVPATGSPAYARKPFTGGAAWSAAAGGVVSASVTFDIPAGQTVTFVGVCSSVTQGAATVLDKIAITSQNFATQGTLTVNFTFSQT